MDGISADVVGAVVRAAGFAVCDNLARSLSLTGNIGTTPGMHAGRAQTLQCIHPQRR